MGTPHPARLRRVALSRKGRGGVPLLLQDVRGALVAGEEVRAFGRLHERLQRADAGEQADEVVLAAEREHGVDEVVADAGFALLNFEAIDQECDEVKPNLFDVCESDVTEYCIRLNW